jgi:hypothetical protein
MTTAAEKEDDGLYTVYIAVRQPMKVGKATVERDVLFVYYDVTWKQVGFYTKKHGAQHCTVERQNRMTGKTFETQVLEDIRYSDEAIKNTRLAREKREPIVGIPSGGFKKIDQKHSSTPHVVYEPSPKVDSGYAELVNQMMKESA